MGRLLHGLLLHYGLPAAGLILFLEGIGVPIPVEVPLVILGDKMTHRDAPYWNMVALMWTATMAGNLVGYSLGYMGGRPLALRLLGWFRIRQETWDRLENWFRRHGLKAVVATRLINWGFAQNMWLCGITRVPFGRFVTVMAINNFLWAMGWMWLAKAGWGWISHTLLPVLKRSMRVHPTGLAIFAILIGIGIGLWRYLRSRRQPNPPDETAAAANDAGNRHK